MSATEDKTDYEEVETVEETQRPATVIVHVYDLGTGTAALNGVLNAVGSGAYHTGVEVYCREWSFGFVSDRLSGVFAITPKTYDAHMYRESISMGDTTKSPEEVKVILQTLHNQWKASSYHLLYHNCTHFANDFCCLLGVAALPTWIMSLSIVGTVVSNGVSFVGAMPVHVGEGLMLTPRLIADTFERISSRKSLGIKNANFDDEAENGQSYQTNEDQIAKPRSDCPLASVDCKATSADAICRMPVSDKTVLTMKEPCFDHGAMLQSLEVSASSQTLCPQMAQTEITECSPNVVEGDAMDISHSTKQRLWQGHAEDVSWLLWACHLLSSCCLCTNQRIPGEREE